MSDTPANGGTLTWRVTRAEEDIKALGDEKASKSELALVTKELSELKDATKANTRALIGFSFVVAAAAVTFAFAVLQAGGS